jgi:thymidylate synthase (FAD)
MADISVEYLSHMGSDDAVCDAARVSFSKQASAYTPAQNAKLISYLARNNHWTPFAHTAISFRIGAAVPIRTQCFKHKQGFVENEESRRYISSTPELFIPDEFRTAPENAKQGSSGTHPRSDGWKELYVAHCQSGIELYKAMIAVGIAPEQARFVLPQGVIVNWVWTGNLASFARFYRQRTDPHAQREVQIVAEKIGHEMARLFPVSWAALTGGAK